MDKKKVFETLGISQTKDRDVIKKAYRGKLVGVNPEDNPEGFKLLREAYEEALRLIDVEEEKEETLDTPIKAWIRDVERVYSKLSTRINVDNWRDLFHQEVCVDFDRVNEARDALLEFLMDNFRLSPEVWQLMEDTFEFSVSKEDLYEKFPVNFIDFIVEKPEEKGWIDLTLFKGKDEDKVDEFISLYLSLRAMNDRNQYEEAEEVFHKLEEIHLWHPYLEGEKMRYFLRNKKFEEAKSIADNEDLKICSDLFVKYFIARTYLEVGELEKAFHLSNEILEVNSNYFGAKEILGDYYLKKGEYKVAKERFLELLNIDNYNEGIRQSMQKANVEIMKDIEKKLEENPDNEELKMELAWCLYQNMKYEECLKLLDRLQVNDEIYYDYHNLKCRVYMTMEEYEKAFPYLEIWLKEILNTKDDGTEKTKRRLERLSLAYYFMSKCYFSFGMKKQDKKEDLNKSLHYINLALEEEKGTNDFMENLWAKAEILLNLEENKLCIEVCDEIIKRDKGYYPAYVLRQKAYFNLKMPEEVIDDYFNAIEIYSEGSSPYVYAVKVYQIYDQCGDAENVINRAEEAGVKSNELSFLKLKNRRMMADTEEERKAIIKDLEELYSKTEHELGDLSDIGDLLYEKALCHYYINEDETALNIVEKRLSLKRTYESIILRGDILYYLARYEESIVMFEEILEEDEEDCYAWYKIGLCYSGLEKDEEALECYGKLIEIDPQYEYVNYEVMKIYKKRYLKNYKAEDFNKALKYAEKQAEISPNSYSYTDLGLVYLDAYKLKEAIEAFEKAISYDEKDPYPWNNIGYAYKIMGNLDKAEEFYKKSIERMDNGDLLPHYNLAVCYRTKKEYEKSIEVYEEIATEAKKKGRPNKRILEMYKEMKLWDKALERANKILEIDEDYNLDYLLECGNIYALSGEVKKARSFYKEALKKFLRRSKVYITIGNYFLYFLGKKRKALKYYIMGYKVALRHDNEWQEQGLEGMAMALKELGKEKKAKPYVDELIKIQEEVYGSLEHWLNNPERRKERLYKMAMWSYYVGDYEGTKHYMSLMKDKTHCGWCPYGGCHEYLELQGRMLELEKDYKGALEKYEKALEQVPDEMRYLWKVRELREKVKERLNNSSKNMRKR